jgi:hypothetical protein
MSYITDIVEYLETQGIGTRGTNLFYSQIPDDATSDFLIGVYGRTGPAPDIDLLDIKKPMFQIIVRSVNFDTGQAKLKQIRELLHGIINRYLVVAGTYFRRIQATSEGGHIGINENNNKDEFSINFMTEIIDP